MKLSLVASFVSGAVLVKRQSTACIGTNRLCISSNSPVVSLSAPLPLYFPSVLFPVDIDSSSLVLAIYHGSSDQIANPCNIQAPLFHQAVITPPKSVSDSATLNVTVVTMPVLDPSKVAELLNSENQYFFQLSDPASRQCLLGPSLGGVFSSSIQFDLSSLSASSSSTSTSAAGTATGASANPATTSAGTTPVSSTPSSDTSLSSTKIAIIASVSAFVLLVLLGAVYIYKTTHPKTQPSRRHQERRATPRTPGHLENTRDLPSMSSLNLNTVLYTGATTTKETEKEAVDILSLPSAYSTQSIQALALDPRLSLDEIRSIQSKHSKTSGSRLGDSSTSSQTRSSGSRSRSGSTSTGESLPHRVLRQSGEL
ncbi:hypothetical protein HDV03_004259 [Kappamyces sp. JEL0829]|nr:hypothetical protein HDV03_004259 [Kappamyces sp. JEL0829]